MFDWEKVETVETPANHNLYFVEMLKTSFFNIALILRQTATETQLVRRVAAYKAERGGARGRRRRCRSVDTLLLPWRRRL